MNDNLFLFLEETSAIGGKFLPFKMDDFGKYPLRVSLDIICRLLRPEEAREVLKDFLPLFTDKKFKTLYGSVNN